MSGTLAFSLVAFGMLLGLGIFLTIMASAEGPPPDVGADAGPEPRDPGDPRGSF